MRVEGVPLKDSKRRGMEGLGIANNFVLFKGWRRLTGYFRDVWSRDLRFSSGVALPSSVPNAKKFRLKR